MSHHLLALSGANGEVVKQHDFCLHIMGDGDDLKDVVELGRPQPTRKILRTRLASSKALEPPMPDMGPVTMAQDNGVPQEERGVGEETKARHGDMERSKDGQ